MADPVLAVNVSLFDPTAHDYVTFAAGTTPPLWAQQMIYNPSAWVGGVAPFSPPATPASPYIDVKESVRVATLVNMTLSGPRTVDGVSVVAGDRVLVKAQTDATTNGIYLVQSGAWVRATDADASSKVTSGMTVFVTEGTANGDKAFSLITLDPIVLGTTALTFGAGFGGATAVDLSAEAAARAAADTAEASTRSTADTTETTARTTADTTEATTRAAADTSEATTRAAAITTEATTRATADTKATTFAAAWGLVMS